MDGQRVLLRPGDECVVLLGTDLESAVTAEYLLHERLAINVRKTLQTPGKDPATRRLGHGALEISLCGRLTIDGDGATIDEERLQGRQARLVFAYLVVNDGRPVPREELADAIWGETPPATWEKGLTVIVSRLRGLLTECGLDGAKLLTSAFGCYRLDLPEGSWVDVVGASSSADEAEHALSEGELERAASEAGEAASLARRRFLPGEEGRWVDERRRDLDEVLSRALLCLGDVALRSGLPADAVRYAEEAIALEPYRDSGYRRLMEAHAAAGDRAEGLRVYERCRRLLAEELGAYPSPETEAIYRELLQTPVDTSAPEQAPAAGAEEPRRRLPVIAVAALLIGAIAIAAVASSFDTGGSVTVVPNSVTVIDPETNGVVASVPVGARPTAVAARDAAVWVANADDGTVSRIDQNTRKVMKTIGIGAPAIDLALESDAVWVANGTAGTVSRIDPADNAVTATLDLKGRNQVLPNSIYAIAAGEGAVWVGAGRRSLFRIDRRTHEVTAAIDVVDTPITVAAGQGATWIATDTEQVLRVEPRTNRITARVPAALPVAIAAGEGGVWLATQSDSVWRIDPATGAVVETIPVGKRPLGLTAAGGSVWVANGGDGTVSRIDPRTNRVVETIELGYTPAAVSVGAGGVWVAVQREPVT